MDWDKLRIFNAVAQEGSLTRAGESLRVSQSAVSRQISALEESLSVTLFHRHARGLILTEQGELLFISTKSMATRLDSTLARLRDSRDEIFGELRVTTSVGFGNLWLAPRLATLYKKHPNIKIDLILDERVLDLPMREADVAIRMKEPSQADLIRRKLMTTSMRLFATPTYLTEVGEPKEIKELANHRIICQGGSRPPDSITQNFVSTLFSLNFQSYLTVNNYYGVLQAVRNQLGIGVLPDYLESHFPDLIRVLPELQSSEIVVYLAYPVELRDSVRTQVFRDFVLEEAGLSKPPSRRLK